VNKQLTDLYQQIKTQQLDPKQAASALQQLAGQYRANAKQENAEQKSTPRPNPVESHQHQTMASDKQWREKVVNYIKRFVGQKLDLAESRIDADAPMDTYGIDSIQVMRLTSHLEKQFGPLPKTLFFEYDNIAQLADYFLEAHEDTLQSLLGRPNNPEKQVINDPRSQPQRAETEAQYNPFSFESPPLNIPTLPSHQERSQGTAAIGQQPLDVAIIGLAGRYPEADNVQEFWQNLYQGRDCIREIPAERWDHSQFYSASKGTPGKTYGKWGGFLKSVDTFDPLFFNISPREAEYMDPQERLFMMCVHDAIEDAGYTRDSLNQHSGDGQGGKVGVYVGVMYEEYQLYGAQETALGRPLALSGNPSSIANRVSYYCSFQGPSMAVDTMCSSSLTAIHLACQAMNYGDCNLAVAGGTNVSVHPNKYLLLGQGRFISSKGRCESFGEGGDGYVPGEGVGAVLLKPLAKAEQDGDHIYGVLKSTALNHGGRTNGYSVPNPKAQAQVIEMAFNRSGIDVRSISYLEAHGTGTSLGDPIEIAGLSRAFAKQTADKQFCALGSVKSNIGHSESAAGMAGLTKVLLQMKYKTLVPTLHSTVSNANINFADTPFKLQAERADWQRPLIEINGEMVEIPRRAGISSFGAGGSNAHLIVEEYQPLDANKTSLTTSQSQEVAILLSAATQAQLLEYGEKLSHALVSGRDEAVLSLNDIAYTLQVGREPQNVRLAILADNIDLLIARLQQFTDSAQQTEGIFVGKVEKNSEILSIFAKDDDIHQSISTWLEQGKYDKLLRLWVKGFNINWSSLYVHKPARRVSLPSYPFARQHYWLPLSTDSDVPSKNLPQPGFTREMAVVHKTWQRASLDENAPVNSADNSSIRPLILADTDCLPLATTLASQIQGSRVLNLAIDDVATLPQDVWTHHGALVDLLGCTIHQATNDQDSQVWGIEVLQKFIEQGSRDGIFTLGVTRGLENLHGSTINITGAARAGLYRMLNHEYGHVSSMHLDVPLDMEDEPLLACIVNELSTKDHNSEICYHQGERFKAILEDVDNKWVLSDLPGANPALKGVFSDGGVLWITGGTRGLGYACARHFIKQHGVKNLVLSAKQPLPAQNLWQDISLKETAEGEKIRQLLALENMGAQIKVVTVNLTDVHAIKAVLEEVKQTMGTVVGLIHSAGLTDKHSPAFIGKTLPGISKIMEPKVAGLSCLLDCLQDEPLRFAALFSSVSSTIPSLAVGQSDYTMANSYMDYLAHAQPHQLPLVSLQWPSWNESGMGEVKNPTYTQSGLLSHTDAQGLQLMDQVLEGFLLKPVNRVVMPLVRNPQLWQPKSLLLARDKKRQENKTGNTQSVLPSTNKVSKANKESKSTALRLRTEEKLVQMFAVALKMGGNDLDINTTFQDYGVDSILLTQVNQPLVELIGTELDPSIVYEYDTIATLSGWLIAQHGEAIAEVLMAETQSSEPEIGIAQNIAIPAGQQAVPKATAPPNIPPRQYNGQEPIAVIGMSARFPGAPNLDAYWRLLASASSAIAPVPESRWGQKTPYYAGLVDDITQFDPAFFLIDDADARVMDPQALLLLEECLKLIYHAGYQHAELKGQAIGVYIGARSRHQPSEQDLLQARNPMVALGPNYLATNISHFFDFNGPSMVVDTACSSSLVAMQIAIQSLRSGDTTSAIVAGVSVLSDEGSHRLFQQRNILSQEDAFHVFDRRAQGILLGEGVGAVLLKPLARARADGDSIYAVVEGLSVNNDGRTAGHTTPNLAAQKAVLANALRQAQADAEQVSYIDANGSGSEVTDLLELKAIQAVYRPENHTPLALGAIKPNIGHILSAEGIASFIKVALMLHRQELLPMLSGQHAMQHFSMEDSPFYLPRAVVPWPPGQLAALNCFADGGTNAHAILAQGPSEANYSATRKPLTPPSLNKRSFNQPKREKSTPESAKIPSGQNSSSEKLTNEKPTGTNIWKQKIALA
jgi:polyketide synthase PksN